MKNSVSSRLAEATAPEVARTIYAPPMRGFDQLALERMCFLNEAHALMLADRELITREIAVAILKGICQIREEGPEKVDLDPRFEDSYFAFENRLGAVIGKAKAGWLHMGRSRNDIGSTLDRMAVRDWSLDLLEALSEVRRACLESARVHAEVVMPGYTHLQPAQPITFGYYLANVARGMEREYDRIGGVYERADECALGSAAFAGTSFPIDRRLTADLLGFEKIAAPGLDAVASRDFVTELLWAVTSFQVLASRVAQDFYVFTSWEFNALSFPDSLAGTSSIMPQKKNMLPLEYFRAEAGRSIGALSGVLSAVKGSNYSIGLDSAREGLTEAWLAFARFADALPLLKLVFETAAPNAEKLLKRCSENFSTATDIADGLVREHGVSFREAHHIVGRAVQLAIARGEDASGLTVEILNTAAKAEVGSTFDISEDALRHWTDPTLAVASRKVTGGPAPETTREVVDQMETRLRTDAQALQHRRKALKDSKERLMARINAFLK